MNTPAVSFLSGAKAVSPILLGVAPFALIYGVSAIATGIPALPALAMSVVVFAGASQLAAIQLLGENSPIAVIVLTGLVINLRMAMYSASLAPHFSGLPARWKGPLAYFLTDQAYAVAIARFSGDARIVNKKWYYLGAGLLLWCTWVMGSAAGVFLGAAMPRAWSLDFAIPLTFIALALPIIRDLPAALTAIVAAIVAVAAHDLPFNTWLLLASGCGIASGFFYERQKEA